MRRRRRRLTRRAFVAAAGGLGGALLLPGLREAQASPPPGLRESALSMLVDTTRCIGCRACVRACGRANRLTAAPGPADDPGPGLRQATAWNRWTTVNREGPDDGPPVFVKRQCLHCLEPACASVCPVGALHQTDLGPVIYRAERCIGCRYCMVACPFDVPRFEWDNGLTPVISKCQFCFQDRLLQGLQPACAEACPTGALKFGSRADLLFEAHARIHARPERYHPDVYGEDEAGGTTWLYLSATPFDRLGFRTDLERGPLPSLTWMVIARIPAVAGTLAVLFGLLATGLKREERES